MTACIVANMEEITLVVLWKLRYVSQSDDSKVANIALF